MQYKLTPDGRFLLEFFRINEFEEMIETEVIETGIGVIFRRDYDELSELFDETEEEQDFTNE